MAKTKEYHVDKMKQHAEKAHHHAMKTKEHAEMMKKCESKSMKSKKIK